MHLRLGFYRLVLLNVHHLPLHWALPKCHWVKWKVNFPSTCERANPKPGFYSGPAGPWEEKLFGDTYAKTFWSCVFAELFRDNVVRHVSGKVDSRFAKHFLIFSLSCQEKDSAAADKGAPVPSRSHQHHFPKVKNLASVIFFQAPQVRGAKIQKFKSVSIYFFI